jgi:cytochrome c553
VPKTIAALRAASAVAAVLASAHSFAQSAPAADAVSEADLRAGAYLAANCANCHGTAGVSPSALPPLAGLSKAYLVEQMRAFRDGKRSATIMHQLAKGYTDQQVELMGEYFARQKPAVQK